MTLETMLCYSAIAVVMAAGAIPLIIVAGKRRRERESRSAMRRVAQAWQRKDE